MLRRNDTQYSKFWMGEEEFEFDPKHDFDAWDTDTLLRLASFKRAVANFVRIVTGKDIPVVYNTGEQSFTDGKSVVLSAKLEHNQFDTAVGVALHEGSHCAITDSEIHTYMASYQRVLCKMNDDSPRHMFEGKFRDNYSANTTEVDKYVTMLVEGVDYDLVRSIYKRLLVLHGEKYTAESKLWEMSKLMENWIEDRRIDYYQCKTSPGYKGYYNAMYQSYFYSKLISKAVRAKNYARTETWDSYKFRIINILNADTDLDALKGLRKVWEILDLNNVNRLTSVLDSWNLGFKILDVILNHLVVEKKEEKKEQKKDDASDASDKSGSKSEKGKSGKSKKSEEKYDDEEDDSPEPSDDDKSDDGDGSEPEDNNKTGDDNYDGGTTPTDKSDEEGDKDGEGDGDKSDEEGDKDGKGGASDNGGEESDEENLSPAQMAKMKKEEEKQKSFLDGDIAKKKMSKKNASAVKSLESGGVTLSGVGSGLMDENGKPFKVQCVVVKKVTKELIDGGVFHEMFSSYESSTTALCQEAVNEGFRIGTVLGKRLQIRNEARTTKFNRLETGRMDKKLIASLGYDNVRVFFRTMVDKFNPMVMHISVDGSGSMWGTGGSKWKETMTLLVTIIKAASMTSNLNVVVSVRGTASGANTSPTRSYGRRGRYRYTSRMSRNDGYAISIRPMIAIVYDSRVDKLNKVMSLFKYIYPNGGTPDGLAFEPIIDEMVVGKSGEVESVFVNISDGAPCFSASINNGDGTTSYFSYAGGTGAKHTAQMVARIRALNIKVLSYFVDESRYSDSRGWTDFKLAYGKDSQKIDTRNIGQLARTLNETFLKKSN